MLVMKEFSETIRVAIDGTDQAWTMEICDWKLILAASSY
jgi:hypothetical protein